jgi:hypothetical protein
MSNGALIDWRGLCKIARARRPLTAAVIGEQLDMVAGLAMKQKLSWISADIGSGILTLKANVFGNCIVVQEDNEEICIETGDRERTPVPVPRTWANTPKGGAN